MKLKKISISNYRSLENFEFDVVELTDKSATFGLIGVNEAGKTSLLKAIALKDGLTDKDGQILPLPKDFTEKTKDIVINYQYEIDSENIEAFKGVALSSDPELALEDKWFNPISLNVFFTYESSSQPTFSLSLPNCKRAT